MTVVFSANAKKQLKKLDAQIQSRIVDFLEEVSQLENPRSRGKMLVGNLQGFWRYRVGDHRILCHIRDKELEILVVKVGHRRDVYDNK